MQYHTCARTPVAARLFVLILAAFLLLCLSPFGLTAHAAPTDGWEENIELTGEFDGKFSLNCSTAQLFHEENAYPGESWSGQINIVNKAKDTMEVSLLTITSNLEDTALFDALALTIQANGDAVYVGSYATDDEQITPYYSIKSGETLTLNATISFPTHCGNEMIGKEMDSTWTFEAHYPKPDGVQTGHNLIGGNTTSAVYALMAVLCIAAILIVVVRVRAAKRRIRE